MVEGGGWKHTIFHTSTFVRRQRNRIEALQNEQGKWVDDKTELKALVFKFNEDIFKKDSKVGGDFLPGRFMRINEETRRRLEAEYTMTDTQKTLMGMGSHKGLGPVGFHVLFFKKI